MKLSVPQMSVLCCGTLVAGACQAAGGVPGWLGFWLELGGVGVIVALALQARLQQRRQLARFDAGLRFERRMRALAERALAEAQDEVSMLSAREDAVRAVERERIARDIHDDLGQHLLALKLQLAEARSDAARAAPQFGRLLDALGDSTDRAVGSLRAIINDLEPEALQDGLHAAIDWQLQEFSRSSGLPHVLKVSGTPTPARHKLDAALFRILQEALSNIARHAQASQVNVQLIYTNETLELAIADDGIGMPPQRRVGACGLRGIADRARSFGGSLAVRSQPGAGTVLAIAIPIVALPAEDLAHAA